MSVLLCKCHKAFSKWCCNLATVHDHNANTGQCMLYKSDPLTDHSISSVITSCAYFLCPIDISHHILFSVLQEAAKNTQITCIVYLTLPFTNMIRLAEPIYRLTGSFLGIITRSSQPEGWKWFLDIKFSTQIPEQVERSWEKLCPRIKWEDQRFLPS